MRGKIPAPDRSTDRATARSAVAVSVAALITAAALFGALAPKAAALEGPLINNVGIALQ
ncbi:MULTISPECIES: hypothetical protein [unclassified Streptomyces]|uniref:hypothetical protein n=1 Tax=unclassified Streptomyces TaxID=2593676 RepID=UPI000C9A4A99|nr:MULTISPECIES: hypothetical protein [unclassified Streptomyces]WKX20341.1 hypothetical protein Q3Y68_20785 [Streptomyces sp. HUAS CX7]